MEKQKRQKTRKTKGNMMEKRLAGSRKRQAKEMAEQIKHIFQARAGLYVALTTSAPHRSSPPATDALAL